MALVRAVRTTLGSWVGTSKLHLSWLPEGERVTECPSNLSVRLGPKSNFAVVDYTWIHEGHPQQGTLMFAGPEAADAVTGAWVDSWHQNTGVMQLDGKVSHTGHVTLNGHYPYEGSADWGWRIEFIPSADGPITIKMTNISPVGDEEWAVEATYHRGAVAEPKV